MAYVVSAARRLVCLLCVGLAVSGAWAQKTTVYTDEAVDYRAGLELYDKAKYSAAQEKFDRVIAQTPDTQDEVRILSEYYHALCAMKLFHPDAEYLLQRFIDLHPESPQAKMVYMHLGRHFYSQKKYKKALEYFAKVDRFDLPENEQAEYFFKKGYSHFQQGDTNPAAMAFAEIKDKDTEYSEPALYYYSHIAYHENRYQVALEGFEKLRESATFKSLVPYYIAQIYYLQQKYDRVIEYAPPLLDSASEKRKPELAHLIGDSYYQLQRYDVAVPYLEQYIKSVTPTREENYQMGYAYYRSGMYHKAAPYLNRTVNGNDAMAQNGYYHLAECYLRMNEKSFARNAYEGAARLEADPRVQEDAMFSYARLAYELSDNPFHEAITALQQYLEKYPNSSRRDEAYSFLINVYLTTRNYAEALQALDKIKQKDFRMQTAYQMVAFNRGVELFRNNNYREALSFFEKVKTYPIDKKLNYESRFWIAECQYALREYDKAIGSYEAFQREPGAFSSAYYNLANYNMAYAWYDKGMDQLQANRNADLASLNQSLLLFRKYVADKDEQDKVRVTDANIRIGDIYYVKRENDNAVQFYTAAYRGSTGARDYALFQSALCNNLLGRSKEAISSLRQLLTDFPSSKYVPESIFEIAQIHRENDERQQAIDYYQQYISRYPSSPNVRKALGYMALTYYRDRNYKRSEEIYRRMLSEYTNPEDVKTALDGLKPVLTEQGRVDEWVALVRQYDKQGGSDKEIENTLWDLAENAYESGDCEKAIVQLNKYIGQFTAGTYATQAHFYRAECLYRQQKEELALPDYEYVSRVPGNPYLEYTHLRLATAWYARKDYPRSLGHFRELEKVAVQPSISFDAQLGLMRCYYLTGDYAQAEVYARKVLGDAGLKDDLRSEAHFVAAQSLFRKEELNKALSDYLRVAALTKNVRWAESRYQIARIYYLQGDYRKSEKEIFDYAQVKPNYDYWLAKAYILLADNYVALNDPFQAKATLKSIIDNYKAADEIVPVAEEKYNRIIEQENLQNERRNIESIDESGLPGTDSDFPEIQD